MRSGDTFMIAPDTERLGRFTFSRAGMVLLSVLIVWLLPDFDAWRVLLLVLVCGLALIVGREFGEEAPWFMPTVIVSALAVAMLLDVPGTMSSHPLAGPLGYSNVKAALYAQGVVAGMMLAIAARSHAGKTAGWVAAGVFALVPPFSESVGATVGVGGIVVLLMTPRRWATVMVIGCGVAFLSLLVVTSLVAAGSENRLSEGLDERRVLLWRDAWSAMLDSPVRGVGVDGFVEASATASRDRDARWAHNDFLELGAEQGMVALGLVVAGTLWLYLELVVTAAKTHRARFCLLGTAALTVLVAHACVDYIAHFAIVPVVAALLVGTGLGAAQRKC
jgi:O-antigen ligase